jgi:hypothetical protein
MFFHACPRNRIKISSRDLLDVYAFIPSYVFYPQRGCYQFDVELNGGTQHITVEIK